MEDGEDKDNNGKSKLFELLIDRLQEVEEGTRPSVEVAPYIINFIALVVTVVWAASFVADVMMKNYNPPAQIHAVMLAIVGALFGFQVVHRTK